MDCHGKIAGHYSQLLIEHVAQFAFLFKHSGLLRHYDFAALNAFGHAITAQELIIQTSTNMFSNDCVTQIVDVQQCFVPAPDPTNAAWHFLAHDVAVF